MSLAERCPNERAGRRRRVARASRVPMGFLKRFFRNVFRDESPVGTSSSFEQLSEEQLEAHLGVARYGEFVLTDAIRPSFDLQVVPAQGYRHDVYFDEESRARVPVLMAAASNQGLFETF